MQACIPFTSGNQLCGKARARLWVLLAVAGPDLSPAYMPLSACPPLLSCLLSVAALHASTPPHPTTPHTPSLQRQTTLLRTRTVGQSSKVRLRDHVTTVNTGEQRLAATRVQLAKWASRVGHTGGRGSRKP